MSSSCSSLSLEKQPLSSLALSPSPNPVVMMPKISEDSVSQVLNVNRHRTSSSPTVGGAFPLVSPLKGAHFGTIPLKTSSRLTTDVLSELRTALHRLDAPQTSQSSCSPRLRTADTKSPAQSISCSSSNQFSVLQSEPTQSRVFFRARMPRRRLPLVSPVVPSQMNQSGSDPLGLSHGSSERFSYLLFICGSRSRHCVSFGSFTPFFFKSKAIGVDSTRYQSDHDV